MLPSPSRRKGRGGLQRIGVLGAVLASLALVLLLGLLIGAGTWLVLGRPDLPSPTRLSTSQFGDLTRLGIGVAAAVGATVALVVAYRNQRDKEGQREALLYQTALKDLGSESAFVRLAGVYALRDLADLAGSWRQRCVDVLCTALGDSLSGEQPNPMIADAIVETLKRRLSAIDPRWANCTISLQKCVLDGFDLSGICLRGGTLILSNVVVGENGLSVDNLKLQKEARLVCDGLEVGGHMTLRGLVCESHSHASFNEVAVRSRGYLELSRGRVSRGSEMSLDRTAIHASGRLRLEELEIQGSFRIGELLCGRDAEVRFRGLSIRGGELLLSSLYLSENSRCGFGQTAVQERGLLRIEEVIAPSSSTLDFAGGALQDQSALLLESVLLGPEAVLAVSMYNKGGSLLLIDASLEDAHLELLNTENEGRDSTLVLRARMRGHGSRLSVDSGGNYGGHAHVDVQAFGNELAGSVRLAGVRMFEGQVALDIDPGQPGLALEADPTLGDPCLWSDVLGLDGEPTGDYWLTKGGRFALGMDGRCSWHDHTRVMPSGAEFPSQGSRQFSRAEREAFAESEG